MYHITNNVKQMQCCFVLFWVSRIHFEMEIKPNILSKLEGKCLGITIKRYWIELFYDLCYFLIHYLHEYEKCIDSMDRSKVW